MTDDLSNAALPRKPEPGQVQSAPAAPLPPVDETIPADATLDEMRPVLARAVAREAAFDGWTWQALDHAAQSVGIDPGIARLVFREGAIDMIDAWFATIDSDMLSRLSPATLTGMKIRERITALVQARLDLIQPQREALFRAQSFLAQPRHLARATRLSWRAADVMWRAAGDTATDYNHYTKRLLLSGVYASTLMAMRSDNSPDLGPTRAFLARRIHSVMKIESVKHQWLNPDRERLSLTRFLGRLRYPAR